MSTVSYKDAGVDIDAGNQFVENIKPIVKSTFDSNVVGGIGSFAGAYELPTGYKKPVMLGATDGVGTKLKLAIDSGKYDTVGIDLVAMCVNDLICNFGTPLFFLDYYATAKLEIADSTAVVKGIAQGCIESECSLIGGETAEMPGMYSGKDFDLAGFSVGIAEKDEMNRLVHVKAGDVLVALPSSGVHSNGFSLVRKLFFEKLDYKFDTEFDGKPLIDTLLTPTKLYVKTFKKLKNKINALAHITGGGIVENLPRVLPEGMQATVYKDKIKTLRVFDFMSKHVEEDEMYRTFNMGVGMVLVVSPENVDAVLADSDGYVIGELKEGEKKAIML
ncbi:phosphoribosylformylglycinamidine cyclo-ligase [Sulfurospirillum arcachonense]|uniref:phosphoribosylformylglycinamidine cyclo-ligase n=1 Tax=Sulfurospirillum arcachonense TaxID=57666 RepID=UPI00046AF08D|nr:phosphoribosylformylglycinamidine cyclo-ligase [Sulfurospirillum arcachonense]